jgi:hypothetical protein
VTERLIVIPRWDDDEKGEGFQHYKDRDPKWIKNYRNLLKKDEYRDLTFVQRGILHGLWLEYAASNREIRDSTLSLTRRLGQRVTRASLDSLNHAGFITFSASKPLAPCYHDASLELEEEKEKNTTRAVFVSRDVAERPKENNKHEEVRNLIDVSLREAS